MPARRTALALLRPADRDRRIAGSPGTVGLDPDDRPPAWLPAEGEREWRRIVAACCAAHPRWLQQTDRAALAAYASAWATFVAASRDVAKRGPLVAGRSSADDARGEEGPALVRNPAVAVARDASVLLRVLGGAAGVQPGRAWPRQFGRARRRARRG